MLVILLTGCTSKKPDPTTEPTQPTEAVQTATEPTQEAQTEEDLLFVHFIDVGQADCSLIKLGDLDILIDGGNAADGFSVYNYLSRVGVDDIDLMIATHAHEDHYGGLSYVLNRIETEQVWVTTDSYVNSLYGSFCSTAQKQGLTLLIPEIGHVFERDGLTVTVLGPMVDYEKTNNTSLVVMVEYGQYRFLFTADMESLAEEDLLASGVDLSADVLKVGHHGSYTSSSAAFLDAVDAEYGVIHVGEDNEYGHPHDVSMNRLLGSGITLYRTDRMGSVVIATDGTELAFLWSDASAEPENSETP